VAVAILLDDSHVRDVVARHRRNAPVARGSADDAVGPRKHGEQVQVEAVAQERVAEAGGAHVLLGPPVVPGEREGGLRSGAQEGQVHDPLDAGRHRSVYGGDVLPHPVVGLAGRNHKEGPCTGQGLPHRSGIFIGGFGGFCSRKVGSAVLVADDPSGRAPGLPGGPRPGHPTYRSRRRPRTEPAGLPVDPRRSRSHSKTGCSSSASKPSKSSGRLVKLSRSPIRGHSLRSRSQASSMPLSSGSWR
jgi:hypothetical protein